MTKQFLFLPNHDPCYTSSAFGARCGGRIGNAVEGRDAPSTVGGTVCG